MRGVTTLHCILILSYANADEQVACVQIGRFSPICTIALGLLRLGLSICDPDSRDRSRAALRRRGGGTTGTTPYFFYA